MDHHSFDHLARLLGGSGSRRTVLGALLSAGLLHRAGNAAAKRRHRPGTGGVRSQAQSRMRSCPNPKPGQNLSSCNFANADLRGKNLRGANLTGASFASANLCGADLRSTNLAKVNFTNANLTQADLRGTNLSSATLTGARFCQTRKPNGTLDDSGCPVDGTACCHDDVCGPGGICDDGVCHCKGGAWFSCRAGNGACVACADEQVCREEGQRGCESCASQPPLRDWCHTSIADEQCGQNSCVCVSVEGREGNFCTSQVGCVVPGEICQTDADCDAAYGFTGALCVPHLCGNCTTGPHGCMLPCEIPGGVANRALLRNSRLEVRLPR